MSAVQCLLCSILLIILPQISSCSLNDDKEPLIIPSPRIIGGTDTDETRYRWFATMDRPIMEWEQKGEIRGTANEAEATMIWSGCSGTLIAPRWIMTASHCLWYQEATDMIWRVGFRGFCTEHDEINCGVPFEEFRGQSLHYWEREEDEFGAFVDVGLVKLDSASTIDPVLLDYNGEYSATLQAGDTMTALGTGKVALRRWMNLPEVLQEAEVGFINDDYCHEILDTGETHSVGFLCSAQLDVSRTCFGDSGGPLVVKRLVDSILTEIQLGVISIGDPACSGTQGYAEVSFAIDYICGVICNPIHNPDAAEECPDWCP